MSRHVGGSWRRLLTTSCSPRGRYVSVVSRTYCSLSAVRAPGPSQNGVTPLHRLCENSSLTPELLKVMLEAYPDAAKEKNRARPRRGEADALRARREISS